MSSLIRFTGIIVVLILATLGILAVAGVLSSTEFWHNVAKVAELSGIIFVACGLVMVLAKK